MTQSVDIIPAVEKDARHVFTTGTSGAQRESVEVCVCICIYKQHMQNGGKIFNNEREKF